MKKVVKGLAVLAVVLGSSFTASSRGCMEEAGQHCKGADSVCAVRTCEVINGEETSGILPIRGFRNYVPAW